MICHACRVETDEPCQVHDDKAKIRCEHCGTKGAGTDDWWREPSAPASCRWCRREAVSAWLLGINHGGGHGLHWGHCQSQALRRNHVAYYVQRLTLGAHANLDKRTGQPMRYREKDSTWCFPDGTPVTRENSEHVDYHGRIPLSPKGRESDRAQLAECIDLAAEVWAHMPDDLTWLDEARAVLASTAPLAAPEPSGVAASEQLDLLGATS